MNDSSMVQTDLVKKDKKPTLGLTAKQIRDLPKGLRIHPNGHFEFRKLYKGKYINKTWPPYQVSQAVDEVLVLLKKINRKEEIFDDAEQVMTMTQACDVFWERHASKKPACDGFNSYLSRIRQHFGSTPYHEVTHEEIEDFMEWLQITEFSQTRLKNTPPYRLANGTINLHHTCLISIFNSIPRWVELGKIPKVKLPIQRNPASLVPSLSETESVRTRALTVEEFERLLAHATPRGRIIYKNAVFTILRRGDLMLANKVLFKSSDAIRGDIKKTDRFYEIAKTSNYALEHMDWTNWRREFLRAVKNAKIEDFIFHDLRRTGATWLFRETNDLSLVQRRLGHATPNQTKVYLGILEGDNVKASTILGNILNNLNHSRFESPAEPVPTVALSAKVCVKCKVIKPMVDFYKNHSHKDGHNSTCKVCSGEAARTSMQRQRFTS